MDYREPLGLVLTGGGALGAWEAGCLEGLLRGGLRFDRVIGYSSGALAGTGAFLGRMDELLERWRRIDEGRILRFSPQLSPLSLFSNAALFESVEAASDDDAAKRAANFDFTVVTVDAHLDRPAYHRFHRKKAWDGPLAARLVASASIPTIFPSLEVDGRIYYDGGIPCGEPLSYSSLEGCRTVFVVEMIRPEERGAKHWHPLRSYEQQGRDAALDQAETGIASLKALEFPPEIVRVRPSTVLDYTMLDFSSASCAPAVEQGLEDAKTYLN
jgi:NTE family protein